MARGQPKSHSRKAFPARLAVQAAALAFIKGWEEPPLQDGCLSEENWLQLFGVLAMMILPHMYHTGMSFTFMTIEHCVVSVSNGFLAKGDGWLQHLRVVQHGGRWHLALGTLLPEQWDSFLVHLVSEAEGPDAKAQAHAQVEDARKNTDMGVHQLLCWYQEGPPTGDKNQACHFYCGEKRCLNPRHLCWGSARDNRYHKWWHDLRVADRVRANMCGEVQSAPCKHAPDDWQLPSKKRKN